MSQFFDQEKRRIVGDAYWFEFLASANCWPIMDNRFFDATIINASDGFTRLGSVCVSLRDMGIAFVEETRCGGRRRQPRSATWLCALIAVFCGQGGGQAQTRGNHRCCNIGMAEAIHAGLPIKSALFAPAFLLAGCVAGGRVVRRVVGSPGLQTRVDDADECACCVCALLVCVAGFAGGEVGRVGG
jgi:hypothetical protein